MGKKKTNVPHVQQSMSQLVSKAALAQLGPHIEQMVQAEVQNLGNQLASETASTLETLFSRLVVLEKIVIEKLGYTARDLSEKVSELQDEKEGLEAANEITAGDIVRIEIKTKTKDQADFQGSSRLKIYKTGSGQTLGAELENQLLGMKTGEVKTVEFGNDKGLVAEIGVDRISRPKPQAPVTNVVESNPEAQNVDQAQG